VRERAGLSAEQKQKETFPCAKKKHKLIMSESVTTFYAPIEYSTDGSRHTVVCEGTWTDDGDVTRLRLDSEHFPAFWISGALIGDVLAIDGGRFDDTWTSSPVRHTEFSCTTDDGTFVISHGDVEISVPSPGTRT